MKKMLTILTSISIISNSAFNIISCSTQEYEEDYDEDFSSNKNNSKLMNEIEENAVFTLLENGIDADFLTTNNTALDAESLIQDEALKNDLSITDLTITDDIEKPLNEGDNEFNIDLVIGSESSKVKTKIKNVKSEKLSVEESEDKVEAIIEQEAEIPIHSTTDNTATAEVIEKKLHDIGEEEAEVEIVNESETSENVSSYIGTSSFASNIKRPSSWILKVTKLKNPRNNAIKKNLTFEKIDTSKVDQASEIEKENIAFSEISKLLNDSSFNSYKVLSTTNTFKEAADIAKEIAHSYAESLQDLKISYKLSNENSLLQVNNNKFQLTFQYKNNPVRTIDIMLNNVTNAQDDREFGLKFIKKEFEKGIDATRLYGWNTIFDALNYFQAEATKINKNAYVSISKNFINKKMKTWKNDVIKRMKKANKSVASLSADLVIDMALYSPHLIHKFLKDNKKDDLSPILSSIKNHSDFYLNGGKEQTIDLEVGYDNPFTAKKTNKKINISKNKKVKTTKVIGKIKNVNSRTGKNAKILLENEKLTVTKKITFNEAILAFKEHLSNTLFFPGTGKNAFEFAIELKSKKQEKENLKRGLNKIKCIIKPNKSSSVFKGKLEVTISISYKTTSEKSKNKEKINSKNNKKKSLSKNNT